MEMDMDMQARKWRKEKKRERRKSWGGGVLGGNRNRAVYRDDKYR